MLSVYRACGIATLALAVSCGGDAVDLGHGATRGWADAPEAAASHETPQTLYASDWQIRAFTLNDTTLYAFVDVGDTKQQLISCPIDRCGYERSVLYEFEGEISEDITRNTTLVLFGDELVWIVPKPANPYSIQIAVCSTSGCAEPRLIASEPSSNLVADASYVYWIDEQNTLQRLAPGADHAEAVATLSAAPGEPRLSLDSEHVYFHLDASDEIYRIRKDGEGDAAVVVSDERPMAFAATDEALYYATRTLAGRVVECALPPRQETRDLAVNQRWPSELQAAQDRLYWVTTLPDIATSTTLWSCSARDCAARIERIADFGLNKLADPFYAGAWGRSFALTRKYVVWHQQHTSSRDGSELQRVLR